MRPQALVRNPSALANTLMIAAGAFVGVGALVLASKAYQDKQEREREAKAKKAEKKPTTTPTEPTGPAEPPVNKDGWGVYTDKMRLGGEVGSTDWYYDGATASGKYRQYDSKTGGATVFFFKRYDDPRLYLLAAGNEDQAQEVLNRTFGNWNLVGYGALVKYGFLPARAVPSDVADKVVRMRDSMSWRIFLNPQAQYVFMWREGGNDSTSYLKQTYADSATAETEGIRYLRSHHGELA